MQHSDLMVLLARTTSLVEVKKKSEGMSVFIVDLRQAIGHGMTVQPIPNMVNYETNELFFENLWIPEENLSGEEGSHIDVSMLESMVEWMGFPMCYAFDGATPPPRSGAAHAAICPYGPFVAGDGVSVMLGLQNEREWVALCKRVLREPALATDERFSPTHVASLTAKTWPRSSERCSMS